MRRKTNHSKSSNLYPIIDCLKSRPCGSYKPEKRYLPKPTPTLQTPYISSRKPISKPYTSSSTEKNSCGTQCQQKPTTGTHSGPKYPTLPITQDLRIGNYKLKDKNHLLSSNKRCRSLTKEVEVLSLWTQKMMKSPKYPLPPPPIIGERAPTELLQVALHQTHSPAVK